MRIEFMRFWILTFLLLFAAGRANAAPPNVPDYNREVRPILSQHCFKCHGMDDKTRMAGLRLDNRVGAMTKLPSGSRAVVPGKPEQSTLVKRIFLTGGLQMPPAHANKPLSDKQKQILKRWVQSGAEYKAHWAFVPPKFPPLPQVKNKNWAKNAIDLFTLAKMEGAGLKPSPEADRYSLIRRVSLDLTGLPPTPDEVKAFVEDRKPFAYERLVDRILASPHYGERWARKWLDLARYADTNGYEKDRPRSIWLYRDWVINALNADMPFNRFTIEQLAGDLLPRATQIQIIATGFHRNTMLNEEGGNDPLEYRFHAMTDRVATTGTVWMGLTVGCAQCHTHKFDPITHKEYYRLMAFLNNADEITVPVEQPDIAAKRKDIEAQIAARQAGLADKFPAADGISGAQNLQRKMTAWITDNAPKAVHWTPLAPSRAVGNVPTLNLEAENIIFVGGDFTKHDEYHLTFKTDRAKPIRALRLEALPDPRLPNNGPGRVAYEGQLGDFFLSEFTVKANGKPVKLLKAAANFGNAAPMIDGDPQSGWSIPGGQGKAHTAVLTFAEPISADTLQVDILCERYYASGLGKFRISVTDDAKADTLLLPAPIEQALVTPEAQRNFRQQMNLQMHFLSIAPELESERAEIKKLTDSLPAYPTTLIFKERPAHDPRKTFLHNRGEFLQPRELVTPGVPSFLNSLPQNAKKDRLTFARWLASEQNPLVGRVTVNRAWAAFFGRGLVKTVEDFGYQGELPTHPELLDWLASAFVRTNPSHKMYPNGINEPFALPASFAWSMKKLHRYIVTSATYRQSSAVTPELLRRDPENLMLARSPRVRLDAEQVRDTVLTASGMLSRKLGGPSVFPPQIASITTEGTYGPLTWNVSTGEDKFRRGLYTFSKRTAPYAMFSTFDAPSGEAVCPRREISNTPLQALTLLNDQVFIEAAQALGKDLAAQSGTTADKAAQLFARCLMRPAKPAELNAITAFFEKQKDRFAKKELNAPALTGETQGDQTERAAWTATARVLLNLDEMIVKP
jgi:hypothetical protein